MTPSRSHGSPNTRRTVIASRALLAPLPTFWIARAWPGNDPAYLLAGVACLAAWLIPLHRRVIRRLE